MFLRELKSVQKTEKKKFYQGYMPEKTEKCQQNTEN